MDKEGEIEAGEDCGGAGGLVTPGLYPKALRGASGTDGGRIQQLFLAKIVEQGVPFGLAEYYLP